MIGRTGGRVDGRADGRAQRRSSLPIVVLFFLAACGKVADPRPPLIRIPQSVRDLRVEQRAYEVTFRWTNPSQHIDGSALDDLSTAVLLRDGAEIHRVAATVAGVEQTAAVDGRPWIGTAAALTVRTESASGKVSDTSNAVTLTLVDVPGATHNLRATVDQRRIHLAWERPADNAQFAHGYIVARGGTPIGPEPVVETHFEERMPLASGVLEYSVTAARHHEGRWISGIVAMPVSVEIVDRTPPRPPSGIHSTPGDVGGFLVWDQNGEADLMGYRVYRSESDGGEFRQVTDAPLPTNAFFDPAYRPGLFYAVTAVDEAGNESGRSGVFRVP